LVLEYRFKPFAYNSLKGAIGEQLARSFIRDRLASTLVELENWDHVVLSNNDYKRHAWTRNKNLFSYDEFRQDFVAHGFYGRKEILCKYAAAVSILEQNHCTPDGLLLKLQETGKKKKLGRKALTKTPWPYFSGLQKNGSHYELPVVDGDLEIVEIKCGRNAKLNDKQKKAYNDLIAKSIPLRLVRVRFVSFDLNRFLVEEKKHERFV
jgi:hypothetical protein